MSEERFLGLELDLTEKCDTVTLIISEKDNNVSVETRIIVKKSEMIKLLLSPEINVPCNVSHTRKREWHK